MRHTNFEKQISEIRRNAIKELETALSAYGKAYILGEADDYEKLAVSQMNDRLITGATSCYDGIHIGYSVDGTQGWVHVSEAPIEDILTMIDAIPSTPQVKDAKGVYPIPIEWIDVEDIEGIGYDASSIDQDTLYYMASYMGEALEDVYQSILFATCEHFKIKRK